MSTPDTLLLDLYQTAQNTQARAMAARHAPVLRFDANEPFLPLAAGFTLFEEDGPSPSMERTIELRPEKRPPAARCIEYAIWWDWDIHHLYELEHVWVYLDEQEQPVRVEASWHGKYYEIPIQWEAGRVILLSEPGKHAFAPDASWFRERASRVRRVETRSVSAQAGVLVNAMFAGKIRQRVFDRTLARSYLSAWAFDPAWSFSQSFLFPEESLVPWDALSAWIPRRVNNWLERLEVELQPSDYRAMRLVSCAGTLPDLQNAAQAGADAVVLAARVRGNRLILGDEAAGGNLDFDDVFRFCRAEPMGAFFEVHDSEAIDRLAWVVRSNGLDGYTAVLSPDPELVARYLSFVPQGAAVIQLTSPDQDPLQAAAQSGAQYICPRWDSRASFTQSWIKSIHAAGLGVTGRPVARPQDWEAMQRQGVDMVWEQRPQPFPNGKDRGGSL